MSTLKNTKRWSLYKHTSPSGKVYIGITSRKPSIRWGKNGCHYKGSHMFYNAILKYGWDNIDHDVLFTDLSEEEAKSLEIKFIKYYKDRSISYNITDGGDGTKGMHPSKESIAKRVASAAKTGYHNQIEILNKNRKQIGVKHRKKVIQFSITGEYIAEYNSIKEATNVTEIDSSMISHCCKGTQFSAGGYIWMYKINYDKCVNNGTIKSILNDMVIKANTPNGSYIRTSDWRNNRSKKMQGKDHRNSETKKLMTQRAVAARSKPILQLSLDEIPINVYKSSGEVERILGFDRSYISSCCKGKKKSAYNFKWRYLLNNEYHKYLNTKTA